GKDKEAGQGRVVVNRGQATTIVVLDPNNAASRARIPTIDKLADLYKDPDVATTVYSFLNKDGLSLQFPKNWSFVP
ncbi:hypothetical protein L195_g061865, partial [Trifolium pratense]